MALAEGSHLGPYKILAPLGAGGMGEVYRARDPRLGREVAIKVLPETVSQDSERLSRFNREARALAVLNHPHILDVHDVGSQDGTDYIVTELLEGETLRNRLGHQRLSSREAIRLAIQIARGLAAAHEKGVVHRDLKPANLFLTKDGTVKILDFGLAKIARPQPPCEHAVETATAEPDTADGTLLGTVDYMSPEQVRGQTVDHRSDIFSFGAVLYEMLAGERPFRGDSRADTTSAILTQAPSTLSTSQRDVPVALERTVFRCLEKSPEDRFQSAQDLAFHLEAAMAPSRPATGKLRWLVAAGAVVAALVLMVGYVRLGTEEARPRPASEASPERKRLVVLPFENLGPPEDADFAAGMTEEITSRLARISDLGVISRTSAFEYDRTGKTLTQIGGDLGVDFVLEGSVRRDREAEGPGRVRISPRLIRVADDTYLWVDSYDRELRDILSLQSALARAIARQIGAAVTPAEETRFASAGGVDAETYEAYLMSRRLTWGPEPEDNQRAAEYAQKAIDRSPDFAPGYAALADAYSVRVSRGLAPAETVLPMAREAALKALELDEGLAEPHASLALVKWWFDWDWAGAEAEYRRALELKPSDVTIRNLYGGFLQSIGRLEEGLAETIRAFELDPLSRDRDAMLAGRFLAARRYDEAIEHAKRALEVDPGSLNATMALDQAYAAKGMHDESISAWLSWQWPESLDAIMTGVRQAYETAGPRAVTEYVLKFEEGIWERGQGQGGHPVLIARLHVDLGQHDEAFEWLKRAYERRHAELVWIKVYTGLDPLHSDPRFQDLLRRMKLPVHSRR